MIDGEMVLLWVELIGALILRVMEGGGEIEDKRKRGKRRALQILMSLISGEQQTFFLTAHRKDQEHGDRAV